ncbi:MAG: B12-binding domain-containing radical SAM protein [Deltaproteobacteria bacterium]|nr:B12-binding domain-containing radical SAM protein [Deltaproteobacteria bacterium]
MRDLLLVDIVPDAGVKNRILPIGLLSVATYLVQAGYDVEIRTYSPEDITRFARDLSHDPFLAVGISCVSGFTYPASIEFSRTAKAAAPKSVVILGGQHVRSLGAMVFADNPHLDVLVTGEGEIATKAILDKLRRREKIGCSLGAISRDGEALATGPDAPPLDLDQLPPIQHELYPGYRDLIPIVEESRNCPHSCRFCNNAGLQGSRWRTKSYARIIQEVARTQEVYGSDNLLVILGGSTFGVDAVNTRRLFERMRKEITPPKLQIYTRVDVPWHMYIDRMADYEFQSVFFGIESASTKMLRIMNKTSAPAEYVRRAEEALREFSVRGIPVWANFIIGYIGESPATLRETLHFALTNQERLKLLTGSCLKAYPGSYIYENMADLEEVYGASLVVDDESRSRRYFKVTPSRDLTYEEADTVGRVLSKIVNTERNYFDIYMPQYVGYGRTDAMIRDYLAANEPLEQRRYALPSGPHKEEDTQWSESQS